MSILQDRKLCFQIIDSILHGNNISIPSDMSYLLKDSELNIFIPKGLEFIYIKFILEYIITGHELNLNALKAKLEKFDDIKDLPDLDEFATMFLSDRDKEIFYKNIDADIIMELVSNDMHIIALVNMYHFMEKKLYNLEGRLSYIRKVKNIE